MGIGDWVQAGLVETENLLCGELAAEPLHLRKVLSVDEIGLPHPLIGAGCRHKHRDGDAQNTGSDLHNDVL